MEQHPVTAVCQYKPSRAELATPETDWQRTWHLARLKGLGPEMTFFLWKLLHRLLPTQNRISRIMKQKSPLCQLCLDQVVEDLPHAFFHCGFNGEAGTHLLNYLSSKYAGTSPSHALSLNFDVAQNDELPLVWFTGFFLQNIWLARTQKKQPHLFSIRADLEARVSLLRETSLKDESILIDEMINLCFSM